MQWKNLQTMKCPECASKMKDAGLGYDCTSKSCGFYIGYEKFMAIINKLMMPRKEVYDPDKVDRSNWEI